MEWLVNLSKTNEFWVVFGALGGTIVGFVLNEATRSFRSWSERRRLKKALRDELETNLFQIEHKKDTLRTMIGTLAKKAIFPGTSVACASAIYNSHFTHIVKYLKPIERDLVQNIYSRLQLDDKVMADFEEQIKDDLREDVVADPWKAHTNRLNDISQDYEVAQELIRSYLDGKPVDVYQRDKKTTLQGRVFVGKVTPEIIRQQRGA